MRLFANTACFIFLAILAGFTCAGQSYYFKHYQVDDGLAHNTVITLMQDSKGMMWMGTKDGLNRFDGYTFRSFKNEHNEFGTLGDNVILSICEDHRGIMWIGTGRGLYRYDPVKEAFTEMPFCTLMGISHILADSAGGLWFLANGNLNRYDGRTNHWWDTGLHGTCMAFDEAGELWLGQDDGSVACFHPQTGAIVTVSILDRHLPLNLRLISKIYPAGQGMIVIGTTKQGVKTYNTRTGEVGSFPLPNPEHTEIYVRDIVETRPGEYWVATESGIYIYNLKTGSGLHIRKNTANNYALSDNAVYSLCRDNQGGLWAGTYFGGLNYYSDENARFQKFYPGEGPNAISGNAVREICSDDRNNIWIGTEDAGINRLDPRTGHITQYTSCGSRGSLSYPNIHGLLAVGNKLYIGPFQHGLEIMDTRTGLIRDRFRLIGEKGHMNADFVMCVYQTRDKTLLVGTTGTGAGLYIYEPSGKDFTKCTSVPGDAYIYAIQEDHEGTIWIGSLERGTFYFNPRTGRKGNIRFGGKSNMASAHDYRIQGIYEDSRRFLWFATEGGGLIRLAPDRKTFRKFTIADGLPSNTLFRILEDKRQNLWISSLKGLICMNPLDNTMKVYTKSNGLITDQFNYNSAFRDSSGRMYFGSVKGMIAFDPAEFGRSEYTPPTYITGFQINDKEVGPNGTGSPLKKSILYTDSIVLDHTQSNFSIEFAALNYASPHVTRYKYRMKGLEKNWTHLSSNRKAYFTDLSPGSYTFVVQAESNTGTWAGRPQLLFIRVLPPFWKSSLAYGVYALLAALLLCGSVWLYHRRVEQLHQDRIRLFEHEKVKEIYEAKIEFFTNIAHEIQTPLTLILGPLERILKRIDEVPGIHKSLLMMDKNGKRLLELTGQLLDFRKTEADQFGLNFVHADITAILNDQVNTFSLAARKNGLSMVMEVPPERIEAYVDIEAFTKISSNLISNAVKYAGSRVSIRMEAAAEDQRFRIRFCNDGKMIPDEFRQKIFEPFFRLRDNGKQGTGIGLSLAKSLTELHHGTLRLVSGDTDQIIFELTLPVHQQFEFKISKWKNSKQL